MTWEDLPETLDAQSTAAEKPPQALAVIEDSGITTYDLPVGGRITVGRAPSCDITLEDPEASRVHACLSATDRTVTIQDLDSNNGTTLNGRQLDRNETAVFGVGDVVVIGSTVIRPQRESVVAGGARAAKWLRGGSSVPARVVADPKMRQLYERLDRIAQGTIAVLIMGETGAGKEIVAEAVHRASPRRDAPYLQINCAALSATLVESELFGHEKGAFTGADVARPGLLASASGGTVLLDEVGELPAGLQAKLLRVVESQTLIPVGGVRAQKIDVRFVSATNRSLEDAVEAGTFRRDLYFRLAGAKVLVPPLRERKSEIVALARQFSSASGTEVLEEACTKLLGHDWPGNIRELRNVIERAALLSADQKIGAEHIELDDQSPNASPPPTDAAPPDERSRIAAALDACAWNQTKAAKMLGMSRRTLTNKLNQYDFPRPKKKR